MGSRRHLFCLLTRGGSSRGEIGSGSARGGGWRISVLVCFWHGSTWKFHVKQAITGLTWNFHVKPGPGSHSKALLTWKFHVKPWSAYLNYVLTWNLCSMLRSMLRTFLSLNMELNIERVLPCITWNALNMEFHVKA